MVPDLYETCKPRIDDKNLLSRRRRLVGGPPEGGQEGGAALAGKGRVGFLDVAEAADAVGEGGDFDGQGVILGAERRHDLGHGVLVFDDQAALHAALRRIAENVEGGAAQSLELRQPSEGGREPRAVGAFEQVTGFGVAARDQGRRQMELERIVALELAPEPGLEAAVGK